MTRLSMVLIAMLTLGCGEPGADTGLYTVQAVDLDTLSVAMDCGCFWSGYGYASELACRADLEPRDSPAIEQCVIDVGSAYPDFEALSSCRLQVASARFNCYSQYRNACDAEGFDACDETRDAAFSSCPDPCLPLSGSARSACETDRAQLQADTASCFGL